MRDNQLRNMRNKNRNGEQGKEKEREPYGTRKGENREMMELSEGKVGIKKELR